MLFEKFNIKRSENINPMQGLHEVSPGVLNFGGTRMALLDIKSGFWALRSQLDVLIGSRMTSSVIQQAGANGGASFASSIGIAKDLQEQAYLFEVCLQAYQSAGFGKFNIQKADWHSGRVVIQAQEAIEAWMMRQHSQLSDKPVCAYSAGVLVGFIKVIAGRRDVVCIERRCQAQGDAYCEFELLPASDAQDQTVIAFLHDPKLGRQINLLELLFERMPMGIAILDRNYHIQRYNPTWSDFAVRYAPSSGVPLTPGVSYFDHLPGAETTVLPLFERTLRGETVRENDVRLASGDIVTYWDIVLTPLAESSEIVGILIVAVDVTDRVQLRQNLEQRVETRTRELQVLLDVSSTANSSLDLGKTLQKTLDLLVPLVEASRAGVLLSDELTGELIPHTLRPEQKVVTEDLTILLKVCHSVMASGEALYVAPDLAHGLCEPGALLPLHIRGNRLGVLVIIGSSRSEFSQSQLALFQSIADQLSVAIENARLFAKIEQAAITAERNRLARDLHDAVTQTLFSSSMIADVLPKIWKKNPEEGYRLLEELRQLTRGALSEMRTLLVELRPASLVDTDLGDLVGHQVNAFIARSRLPVAYTRNCGYHPPPEIKEVFYRIAQEAFNNIAKHAEATQVTVQLDCQPDLVALLIEDNGIGFDMDSLHKKGLGLGIMEDRARNVGARFEFLSRVNNGTRLYLEWNPSGAAETGTLKENIDVRK